MSGAARPNRARASFYGWLVAAALAALGPKVVALLYADPLRAARAWELVGDALTAAGGFAFVILLLPLRRELRPLRCVFAWMMVERFEVGACRLAFPMGSPPPPTGRFEGLCDIATGLPVYMLSAAAVGVWAAWHLAGMRREQ